MHKPHGRYDYCTDIKATIFGVKDEEITLFHEFECEVDIGYELVGGVVMPYCTDVLVDGLSLRNGDATARRILQIVADAAEYELASAGPIWDKFCEAEGLTIIGQPGDPDAHWVRS